MRSLFGLLLSLVLAGGSLTGIRAAAAQAVPPEDDVTQGSLRALDDEGKPLGDCPLEHTNVESWISGHVAQVLVTQKFTNPFEDKIEAVYTFPLGANAAVNDMTMKIGERVIRGKIKRREEAREIYEAAKAQGHVASLLDEERPNIFTQFVANIEPGKTIEIQITYTETLKYEDGLYSFVFPMVVGPRYIPAGQDFVPASYGGLSGRSEPVPDSARITPPVTPEGTRAGHDISVAVHIDAGAEIRSLASKQHGITTEWGEDRTRAYVELAEKKVIPNKDFVLEFSTASPRIEDAVLIHTDSRGGFFTLILQPPDKVRPKDIVPREIVFVLDTSGSMRGFPLDISKSIMRRTIRELRPDDSFNLVTFAGNTSILWSEPRPNTEANRAEALSFLENLSGRGGTEMMKAVDAALGGWHDPEKVRIVAFLTDGYIGNDMQVIDAVRKYSGTTRVFSFGIGTSVNRYLLDGMARAGRGEAEYALSQGTAEKIATKFYDRIDAPVLTDIQIDWGDLADVVETDEVYPTLIPDLFSVKPVVVKGRYRTARDRRGEIVLRGKTASGPFERRVKVALEAEADPNPALASLWARAKVEDLMDRDLLGMQRGQPDPGIKEAIVGVGLEYRLLTKYTSFVAVEEEVVTEGGQPRTVEVPVEMPEGVSYEGVFGEGHGQAGGIQLYRSSSSSAAMKSMAYVRGGRSEALHFNMSADQAAPAEASRDEAEPKEEFVSDRIAAMKLAEVLQGLAQRLDHNGNYASATLTVKNGKLEVALYLQRIDRDVLKKLSDLGFVKSGEKADRKLVTGTIGVDKLDDIARLSEVRYVTVPALVR